LSAAICFTFDAKPRTRNTGLLLQHALRGTLDQRRRQTARFASVQSIDYSDRFTGLVERDTTECLPESLER
jgi:hypothetical protein